MINLILHPQTKNDLEQIVVNKPHAILLTGNEGSGKAFVARVLAETIFDQPLDLLPYFIHIMPEGKSISIAQIRELQKFMKLKTTGSSAIRRIAMLQDVHLMTNEAQNALLKLLEEPPADTMIILTARGDTTLKPTIYSRVQRVHIKPVSIDALPPKLSRHKDIQKLHDLSGGDIGLLLSLINNDADHSLVRAIAVAKEIITTPAFERLAKIDSLLKDKDELDALITALLRISTAAFRAAVLKKDNKNKLRWLRMANYTYKCQSIMQGSANQKLLLTELFLEY